MDEQRYKLWAAEIATLTPKQASAALQRFKLGVKTSPKEHAGKQDFGDRVLAAIVTVLIKAQVESPSASNLRKSAAYAQAKSKLQDLQNFIEKTSQSKLVQDQILKEGIFLLYHDLLQWQKIAISSHLVLRQIHRIPAVINRHYPGYAASGMLTKIVKGA